MLAPWHIPRLATRPWRMFPALDRFTDDECRWVFHDLHRWRVLGLIAAFPVATVLGLTLAICAPPLFEWILGSASPWLSAETRCGRFSGLFFALSVIAVTSTASFLPYLGILRHRIARRVRDVSCTSCSYILFGLPITNETVLCPECGRTTILSEHGLRADDVAIGISARTTESTGPSPWRRRRVLVSLCVCVPIMITLLVTWIVSGERLWFNLSLLSVMLSLMAVGLMLSPDFPDPQLDDDEPDLS